MIVAGSFLASALSLLQGFAAAPEVPPAPALPPVLQEIRIEQKLDAALPLDLRFRDESGRDVALGDYFRGRPVVLVLAYYECPMLCTLVLNGLTSSLKVLPFEPGKDYELVVVSIDPGETPALASGKKATYLEEYGRSAAAGAWHFLVGDEPAIRALADAVGFRYRYVPEQDLYAHAAGIMIVTPGGRMSRYLYGVDFAPKDLRLAMVEAGENKIGTFADQMLLYCYKYDPASGKYGAAITNLVRLGGVITMLGLGGFIVTMRVRESRRAGKGAA